MDNEEPSGILNAIKDYSEYKYWPSDCELTNEDCKSLLNYIISLQEENEKLKEMLSYYKLIRSQDESEIYNALYR